MPKKSSYLLAWSPAQQVYVLSEGSSTAQLAIEPETSAWLEHVPSFAFTGQSGSVTLRKERIHGDVYWYAYRRTGEKLSKKYVGKTAAVTISRLEQMARLLETVQVLGESPPLDVPGTPPSEEAGEPQATVDIEKRMARPPANALHRMNWERRIEQCHPPIVLFQDRLSWRWFVGRNQPWKLCNALRAVQ